MNKNKRFVGHIPVRVNDIDESLAFYQRALGLRHSGTAGLHEDAINVMTRDDLHHLSFTLRPETSLLEFKDHLCKEDIPFTEGTTLPDPTETYTTENCLHFCDPNGHFVEIHDWEVDADAR